jgi:DNA-binding response OmpR family regulator
VNVAHQERILIVDDEPKIGSFIGRALTAAGYATEFACSGADALRSYAADSYDLVILDLVIGDVDGRQLLGQLLTARPDQAVIVLSCVADVAAKVDLLERGAQDYLTKPFSLAELLARVRVRLRTDPHHTGHQHAAEAPAQSQPAQSQPAQSQPAQPQPLLPPLNAPQLAGQAHGEVIRAGHVTLDIGRLVADIGQGPVPLTRLEFLLLRELAEHAGHSVSKGRLLAAVWGYDFDPGSNVVDVCIRRIRSKLGFELIKTVRGEGYQLVSLPGRGRNLTRPRLAAGAALAVQPARARRDLGRFLRDQPRRDLPVRLLGDRPLPLHLDQPDAAVRVPLLVDPPDAVDPWRGDADHRLRHRP